MAEDHARQGFDLDILDRAALDLREIADLRLGEPDVVNGLRRDAGDQFGDVGIRQPEAVGRP